MAEWEAAVGDDELWDEAAMVSPGCLRQVYCEDEEGELIECL
jgi:hypothetical protein